MPLRGPRFNFEMLHINNLVFQSQACKAWTDDGMLGLLQFFSRPCCCQGWNRRVCQTSTASSSEGQIWIWKLKGLRKLTRRIFSKDIYSLLCAVFERFDIDALWIDWFHAKEWRTCIHRVNDLPLKGTDSNLKLSTLPWDTMPKKKGSGSMERNWQLYCVNFIGRIAQDT